MTPREAAEKINDELTQERMPEEGVKAVESIITNVVATAFGVQNGKLGMEEFLRELTASEPESKTAPGLQISWLAERGMYYAAIHVFPMGTVASRTVLVKALDADLTNCLVKLLIGYRESRK